jgi:hypothetical protein
MSDYLMALAERLELAPGSDVVISAAEARIIAHQIRNAVMIFLNQNAEETGGI